MKYKARVVETSYGEIDTKAENLNEALEIIEREYNNGNTRWSKTEHDALLQSIGNGMLFENEDELELTDEQSEQVDSVYEAVHSLCKVITKNDDLEWNMEWLGEIADIAAGVLRRCNQPTHFPGVVTEPDGTQYIEE